MVKLGRRYFDIIKANIISTKNANAPEGKHWDLTEVDYVDNPVESGKQWSNDTYRMEPD